MDNRIIYEERQSFAPWVYSIVVVILIFPLMNLWMLMRAGGDATPLLYGIVCGFALIPILLNLLHLVIQVSPEHVYARLGAVIPFFWKRIPLGEIEAMRVVQYRPLRDAGGWGYRFGRFEGKPCRFLNARGDRGVLLVTKRYRYILGSQEPERLLDALQTARAAQGQAQ